MYNIRLDTRVPVTLGTYQGKSVIEYRVIQNKQEIFTSVGWAEYGHIQVDGEKYFVFRYYTPGMPKPSSWRTLVTLEE